MRAFAPEVETIDDRLWRRTDESPQGFQADQQVGAPAILLQGRTFELAGGRVRTLATEGPSPRHSTPLAWDGRTKRVILYGGKEYAGEEQLPLGDFWAWDGERWKRLDD